MYKYKILPNVKKNKVDDNGNRIGYWELDKIANKRWCGNYNEYNDRIGCWYLLSNERRVITKISFNNKGIRNYAIQIDETTRFKFYSNNKQELKHLEEYE